jgi:hypothetical protein
MQASDNASTNPDDSRRCIRLTIIGRTHTMVISDWKCVPVVSHFGSIPMED